MKMCLFSADRKYLKPNQVSLIGRYPSEYPPSEYTVLRPRYCTRLFLSVSDLQCLAGRNAFAQEQTLTVRACEATFTQVKFIIFELELWEIFAHQRNEPPIQNLIIRRTL